MKFPLQEHRVEDSRISKQNQQTKNSNCDVGIRTIDDSEFMNNIKDGTYYQKQIDYNQNPQKEWVHNSDADLILYQIIMKVIFGIGNPGLVYRKTRHNVGIMFVQYLAKTLNYSIKVSKSKYTQYSMNNSDLVLCNSDVFMNTSGQAMSSFVKKNRNVEIQNIIIVHDDLQHRLGNIRIKNEGSAKGHNGVTSMIGALSTNKFKRLQIGIDRPESREPEIVSKYVLSKFKSNELQIIENSFKKGVQLLKTNKFI